MKHLNRKIALLAFTSLLTMGQSMANEPGLSSIDSATYLAKKDDNEPEKDKPNKNGKWWEGKCTLGNGKNGKICTGVPDSCVKTQNECPPSPS
jgi:hypothetical protein